MDRGYECHLTFDAEQASLVEASCPYGWTFSRIEGDPALGQRLYCYWTAWHGSHGVISDEMAVAISLAKRNGLPLVRAKIEHIIYDQRY